MIESMEEHDAVWAQTTDAGLLQQLFGHYPTMHDAVVRQIDLTGFPLRITMVVDYTDLVEGPNGLPQDGLSARFRLEWGGVTSFDFPLGDEDLLSLDLARQGTRIVTTLETWPGVFGTIVSDTFEAVLMQMEPGPDDERTWIRYEARIPEG
jgi:hypothetical protein